MVGAYSGAFARTGSKFGKIAFDSECERKTVRSQLLWWGHPPRYGDTSRTLAQIGS